MTGIIDNGTIRPAVLVLGATGEVGRGVVRAGVEAGRPLVAVAADAAGLDALRVTHPHAALMTLVADIRSDADAATLASRLRGTGVALDGVVASIAGAHACGRLIDQPADVLRRALDDDLMPHLFAARHLFPLLPHDGAHGYVVIGGPGGDYPWAGYGQCSIAAAALRMMVRVLHDEAGRHGLRVQLLSLDAPLVHDADATQDGDTLPKAVALGRRALAMLGRGRDVVAPAVVGFDAAPRATRPPSHRAPPSRGAALDHVPARELRDARALLSSLSLLPPTSPGLLHDEAF